MDLTVMMLTLNEERNIEYLIPQIQEQLSKLPIESEILIVDGGSKDKTREVAETLGARVVLQKRPRYGGAVKEGLLSARGDFVVNIDADCSHPAPLILKMWENREKGEIVIASRYIPGGTSTAPESRKKLSEILNFVFRHALSIPTKDLSSGFRLYHRCRLEPTKCRADDFDILIELLVRVCTNGYRTYEIPLEYLPRRSGASHAKLARLAVMYLRTLLRLWSLRNLQESADYEARAYRSILPPQRYWQGRRYSYIRDFLLSADATSSLGEGEGILDIGCGSSQLTQSLPRCVAFDISAAKLRFLKGRSVNRVQGTIYALPFRDESFHTIVLSEVIEYLPSLTGFIEEIRRVLKKDGHLVLGSPDYGRPWWPILRRVYRLLPNTALDYHRYNFTSSQIFDLLAENGFRIERSRYILGSELILKATKLVEA